MSRVGKKPITIPSGVTVTINASEMEVKGPKGTLNTPIPAGVFDSARRADLLRNLRAGMVSATGLSFLLDD